MEDFLDVNSFRGFSLEDSVSRTQTAEYLRSLIACASEAELHEDISGQPVRKRLRSAESTEDEALSRNIFDSSQLAKVCLVCNIENSRKTKNMISCDSCWRWTHYSCAKMTGLQAASLRNWFCSSCLSPDSPSNSPSTTHNLVPEEISQALATLKNSTGNGGSLGPLALTIIRHI